MNFCYCTKIKSSKSSTTIILSSKNFLLYSSIHVQYDNDNKMWRHITKREGVLSNGALYIVLCIQWNPSNKDTPLIRTPL